MEDNKLLIEDSLHENSVVFVRREDGPIAQKVNEYAVAEDIDMIVMVNSRHSYMEALLEKSNIDELGLKGTIPLLVMQNLYRNV